MSDWPEGTGRAPRTGTGGADHGGGQEPVAWSGPEGAQAFAAVEAATDWLLGYPFVFRTLARWVGGGSVLVDYGCGPGKVADHAARRLGAKVLGVDTSPEMLALARGSGTAVAEYHLVTDGRAACLADGSADAVMCNHVLASLPSAQTVLAVFREIRRILRPGGQLVLLATDPACSGTQYASLSIGDPGGTYAPGDALPVRLRRTDGSWQVMPNHAWPVDFYPALLERAGFGDLVQHRPTVDEALALPGLVPPVLTAGRTWSAERSRPPLVITTAVAV
ncbi:class I SAM-dependent methyltransferase [Streptomyces sp. NPDC051546]|uniref:class I SAM-dependent methyltransferase n=1 Tax=Streptomyces sp. NPDC051546 TaxID=3365655 RepID=UPI0037A81229